MAKREVELTYERPPLYPKQKRSMFNDARIAVTEACVQVGKTYVACIWLIEKALQGDEGENYWWLAPTYSAAEDAMMRVMSMLPSEMYSDNLTRRRLALFNGAYIWFKSGENPDNLYGPTVHALVVDEGSRISEEAWMAARSRLTATRGPIRIIGNVIGRRNWAYRLARHAEDDDSDYHYEKITALDAARWGIVDPKEIRDAKRTFEEWKFKMLYLAEPPDDESNPFGFESIEQCVGMGRISKGQSRWRAAETEGELEPVVWGWDLGRSQNYTVGIGIDEDLRVVAFERFRKDWKEAIPRIIRNTNRKPALVDATRGSIGDTIIGRLKDEGGNNFRGFGFTRGSKQQLMEHLAVRIQHGELSYPDGPIVDELMHFTYDITPSGNVIYKAEEGFNDDCVDALALAVYHARKTWVLREPPGAIGGNKRSRWKQATP